MLDLRFVRTTIIAAIVMIGALAPQFAAAQSAAAQFVQTLGDRAILELTDKSVPDSERVKRMRALPVASFDVPEVGKFVLGSYWNTATEQQRQDFLTYYSIVVSHTYAGLFKKYSGETFQVLRERALDERDTIVYAQINQPGGGPPVPIEITAKKQPDGSYKAVDIRVEKISMPLTHRKEYASVIQRNRGVDGLIKALKSKAESLEAHTASN
jgi:phospholipid transport system substrate-binding protein